LFLLLVEFCGKPSLLDFSGTACGVRYCKTHASTCGVAAQKFQVPLAKNIFQYGDFYLK